MVNGNGSLNGAAEKVASNVYLRVFNLIAVPIIGVLFAFSAYAGKAYLDNLNSTLAGVIEKTGANTGAIGVIDSRLNTMDQRINEKTADRYTAEDAKRDRAAIDYRFQEIERRLGILELSPR